MEQLAPHPDVIRSLLERHWRRRSALRLLREGCVLLVVLSGWIVLLCLADRKLYEAKMAGRNRVLGTQLV